MAIPAAAGHRPRIRDLDLEAAVIEADGHAGACMACVSKRVHQRLLDDPVRGQVDPGRELDRLPFGHQLDWQTGITNLPDEAIEVAQARLRREHGGLVRRSEDIHQAAHLVERLAAGRLDGNESLDRLVGIRRQRPPPATRLEDDHADRVGNDVVQLASDPSPLVGHRPPGFLVPPPFEVDRASLELVYTLATQAQCDAGDPWTANDQEQDRHVADVLDGPRMSQGDRRREGEHGQAAENRTATSDTGANRPRRDDDGKRKPDRGVQGRRRREPRRNQSERDHGEWQVAPPGERDREGPNGRSGDDLLAEGGGMSELLGIRGADQPDLSLDEERQRDRQARVRVGAEKTFESHAVRLAQPESPSLTRPNDLVGLEFANSGDQDSPGGPTTPTGQSTSVAGKEDTMNTTADRRIRPALTVTALIALITSACGSAGSASAGPPSSSAVTPSPAVAASLVPSATTPTAAPSAEAADHNPAAFVEGQPYDVTIDPSDFVGVVDNPFMPLTPGTKVTFDGDEKIVVTVTNAKKTILGIPATVVRDRVFVDGALAEDTLDWYAQDRGGNVWYLGEKTAEYEGGKVSSRKGSWEAGLDGALPGIIMLADPLVGDVYRQEYYAGEAEDLAEVTAIGGSIKVPFGAFDGVIVTEEWTPLEPDIRERKTYVRGIGVVETRQIKGGHELVQLTGVKPGG
jgi:hypothetical protein